MTNSHVDFGRSGLRLPRVVFGATALGNLFVAMSDEDKAEMVRQWFQHMPKPVAIDSAGKYGAGLSLEVIQRELAALGVNPSDVVVSNKLGWRRVPLTASEPTFEPGVWKNIQHDAVQDISYDGILRCHEDGCQMLGDYHPQLVSVHDPDEYLDAATDAADRQQRLTDIIEAYRALEELRDAGKVAAVGVGAKSWRVVQELDQHCRFDWIMMANSFTIMNHPADLVELIDSLQSRDVAVINSALLHGGFLVGGEFLDYQAIDPSDAHHAKCLQWRDDFTQICQQHDCQPYDVGVAFGCSHPGITSVALSTSNPKRVASMVSAAMVSPPVALWKSLVDGGLIDEQYTKRYLLSE